MNLLNFCKLREVDIASASLPHQHSSLNTKLLSCRCRKKFTDLHLFGAVWHLHAPSSVLCKQWKNVTPGVIKFSNQVPVWWVTSAQSGWKIQNLFLFELAAAAARGIKRKKWNVSAGTSCLWSVSTVIACKQWNNLDVISHTCLTCSGNSAVYLWYKQLVDG